MPTPDTLKAYDLEPADLEGSPHHFSDLVDLCARLQTAFEKALAEVESLRGEVDRYEQRRPYWAQGHTSDGVAAQVHLSALLQIHNHLGAVDQTDCMAKLAAMTGRVEHLAALVQLGLKIVDAVVPQSGVLALDFGAVNEFCVQARSV